jgi:hypothetical protein
MRFTSESLSIRFHQHGYKLNGNIACSSIATIRHFGHPACMRLDEKGGVTRTPLRGTHEKRQLLTALSFYTF